MKIHHLEGYLQSFYLVEYKDGILLLDGLSKPDVKTLSQFIVNELHRKMTDIKLIVTTHPHPDHAGGVAQLQNHYQIPVAAHKHFNYWHSGFTGYLRHKREIKLAQLSALVRGLRQKPLDYPRHIQADYILSSERPLPIFTDWQMIETPGHTNCDISIYHKETKTIYVADLFIMTKDNVFAPIPVSDVEIYKASLDKVCDLEIETVLLAHNGMKTFEKESLKKIKDTLVDVPLQNTLRSVALLFRSIKRRFR